MPEIRYETIETYDNKDNLIGTEQIPYEVSDEELEREEAETIVAKLSALNNDAGFTVPQVVKFLKALAKLRR